ncbi:MAG: glycosyltransferase family 1 protein, partial [Pedobacter sp.]
ADVYNNYKWCENIALLGYVGKEEIVRQFNSCRALLFPSRIETLGLPLLEAASLGKFIIASDLIYARETLSEYENVDFVDPKNPREWGIKLIKTTKDENVTLAKRLPRNDSWASFIKLIHTIIN